MKFTLAAHILDVMTIYPFFFTLKRRWVQAKMVRLTEEVAEVRMMDLIHYE